MTNSNLKWTNNKEFKNTPKTKKETYYLKTDSPSGEELICKCYNVLDEIPTQKAGSMTRDEFEKLYAELSAKTEQRISDMLVTQTRQVIKITKESEQRVSNMLTTKFDQIEQKRLADKAEAEQKRLADKAEAEQKRLADKEEMNQKFNEFKSEIKQEINEFKSEIRQEINEFKSEIRQEINEFKTEIRTEIDEFKTEMNQKFDDFKVEIRTEMNQKFDLVFSTMESNQVQTNDRLDKIEQDIRMLKSFHEEDIKKYREQKSKTDNKTNDNKTSDNF